MVLALLASLAYNANAQNRFLSFTKDKNRNAIDSEEKVEVKPEREVTTSKNSATVTYNIPGGYIAEILGMDKNEYEFIHVDGFGKMAEVGKPALPAHNDILATLGSKAPKIKIISTEFAEYGGFNIHPALPAARDTEGDDGVEFVKDKKTYNTDEFFPKKIVKVSEVLEYRGDYFSSIRISPVQYNPVTKKIRVYSKITYKVIYKGDKTSLKKDKRNLIEGAIINEDALDYDDETESAFEGKDPDYLIVARSDFYEAANKLARWKSQLGYRTEVILKDSWTSSEVKQAVHSRYNDYTPKPSYLAIIGDHEQVPAEVLVRNKDGKKHYYASDLYYVCTGGGSDYNPDMAKGRISGNSPEQALMLVNKGIEYEKNPVNDAYFYKNALNCAQFQDVATSEKPDGIAARRFLHTSEEIRNYVRGRGYSVKRIYQTDEKNTPKRYNNGYYSNGQNIPTPLLRSRGYKWDGNAEDIIDGINKGSFYVLHRDHGYAGSVGWAHPRFLTADINKLANGRKQPIVFSMNCHTGEFMLGESFAEAFVRKKDGGAVGVVAASYFSLSGYNDGLTVGMFDAIWSDPGIKPKFGSGGRKGGKIPGHENNVRTMGDVINQGLIRMRETWTGNNTDKEYTHRLFHYFGDPALRIWTQQPEQITASYSKSIDCGATSLDISNISIAEGLATLVQGDVLVASVHFNSNNASLTFNAVDDKLPLLLTISAADSKPLVEKIEINGCTNLPVPQFTANDYTIVDSPNSPALVSFSNQTTYSVNSYEWTISPSTFTFVDGTDATSENPVVHFTAPGTYSVNLKATNANGSATETKSNIISVSSVSATSCIPVSYNLSSARMCGIYYFEMNEISKASAGTVTDNDGTNKGYMDFTNEIATLKKNQKVDFKVAVGGYTKEHFAMFIDYNNDGEFDNETERVADYLYISRTKNGSFTVIPNPPFETVRMRIISEHVDFDIPNGCYSPRYGQVEDYTVKFVNAKPITEVGEVESLSYTSAAINVELKYNGGVENAEYGIAYSTDPALKMSQWTKVTSTGEDDKATVALTSLNENTKYYVKSYGTNEVGTAYSNNVVEFTTYSNEAPSNYSADLSSNGIGSTLINLMWKDSEGDILPTGYVLKWSTEGYDKIVAPLDGVPEQGNNSVNVQYGVQKVQLNDLDPATTYFFKLYPFANSGADIKYKKDGTEPQISLTTLAAGTYGAISFNSPENLILVKFNSLENTDDRGGLGYIDYTQMYETIVERNKSFNITVESAPASNATYYCSVWGDWNQNGIFEGSEKTYIGTLKGAKTVTNAVAVPAGAKSGSTTLRVMYAQKSTASPYNPTKSEFGSVEDYKVVIEANPGLWKGTISADWNDENNWEGNAVPDNSIDVNILSGAANYPVINSVASAKSINIQGKASLTIEDGADLSVAGNVMLKSGGVLKIKSGNTVIDGNLDIGNNGDGELTVEGGVLNIAGDMYTGTGRSLVNISGGKVKLKNWRKDAASEWTEGTCHFSGGEIDFKNLKFSTTSSSKVVVDGPIDMVVRGYFCNNRHNWTFTDGNLIFRGTNESWFGCAGLDETAVANNVIVENTTGVYFTRHESNRNSYFKIFGDLIVKGKAAGVYKKKSNRGMIILGDFIVEAGAEFNLGDAEPALMKNLVANGTLIADDSEIKFHGYEPQSVICNNIIERFVVNNDAGGVILNSDVTINDKLILRGGALTLNGHSFTLLEDAIIEDAVDQHFPDAILVDKGGEVRQVVNKTELKDYAIPFAYTDIDVPVTADITDITTTGKYISFSIVNNAYPSVKNGSSINRSWVISTEEGFGSLKIDAELTYTDADLGSLDESQIIPSIKNPIWESCGTVTAAENKISVSTNHTGVISALVRPVLNYSIDFVNETTKEPVSSNVKYSKNADLSQAKDGENKVLSIVPNSKLYFEQSADESSLASEIFTLEIPNRAAKPSIAIDYIAESTLEAIPETIEYSTDGFATVLQGANQTLKLEPSKNISFRKKATDNAFSSDEFVLTVPDRPEKPEFTIDYVAETTSETIPEAVEYSTDGFATVLKGTGEAIKLEPSKNISFRKPATENAFRSDEYVLVVPDRPEKSEFTIDYVAETTSETIPEAVEYSTDGFATVLQGAGEAIKLEPSKNISFRKPATDNAFKSDEFVLTVPERPEKPEVTIDYVAETTSETIPEAVEYSTDGFATVLQGAGEAIKLEPSKNISFRKPATDNAFRSVEYVLVVPERPEKPEVTIDYVAETTSETIPEAVEYSTDGFATVLQGTGETIKLEPSKNISFRKPATDNAFGSDEYVLVVPERPEKPEVTIDYVAETTSETIPEAVEYSTDGFATVLKGTGETIKLEPSKNISFRKKATDNAFRSDEYVLVVPERPEKPEVTIDYVAETTSETIPEAIEYSTDGYVTVQQGTGETIKLEPSKNISFRKPATENAFRSDEYVLTVPERQEKPEVTIDYVAETTSEAIPEAVEYSTDGFATVLQGTGETIKLKPSENISFRRPATDNAFRSDEFVLTVPDRSEKPEVSIDYVAETTSEAISETIEYSTDGFATVLQGTGETIKLEPSQNIAFRKKATDNAFKSGEYVLTVPERQEKPEGVTIDYATETTSETISEAIEYSTDGFATILQGTGDVIKLEPSKDISFRKPATENAFRSDEYTLVVPERPEKPEVTIDYLAETTSETIPEAVEYSTDGFATVLHGTGETIKLEPSENISFRRSATDNTFRSDEFVLTVPDRSEKPEVTIDYVAETTSETISEAIEYSTDGFVTVLQGTGETIKLEPSKDISFRKTATENAFRSDEYVLVVPERPADPTAPIVNNIDNTFDFTLNPEYSELSDYEVSFNAGNQWALVESKPIVVGNVSLNEGDILVRIAASNENGNTRFKSIGLANDESFTFATSIENIIGNKLSVYPNPSYGLVFIDLKEAAITKLNVQIFNASGQIIANYRETDLRNPKIDLSGFEKGVYNIKLISDKFSTTEKVVIK